MKNRLRPIASCLRCPWRAVAADGDLPLSLGALRPIADLIDFPAGRANAQAEAGDFCVPYDDIVAGSWSGRVHNPLRDLLAVSEWHGIWSSSGHHAAAIEETRPASHGARTRSSEPASVGFMDRKGMIGKRAETSQPHLAKVRVGRSNRLARSSRDAAQKGLAFAGPFLLFGLSRQRRRQGVTAPGLSRARTRRKGAPESCPNTGHKVAIFGISSQKYDVLPN